MNYSSRNCLLIFCLFFIPANFLPQDSIKINYRRINNILSKNYNSSGKEILNNTEYGSGSWIKLGPNVPQTDYLGIYFLNPDTGWVVGANGVIIYSTNGGRTWSNSVSPVQSVLLRVNSYNGQIVLASGYDGVILRSSDCGVSWTQVTSGTIGDLWEIRMVNDTLGWACGSGPSLIKTTDAGLTWQSINTSYNNYHFWALDYLNKDTVFVAGHYGRIVKTTDCGVTWSLIQTGFNKHLYRIKAFSTSRIVSGGEAGWVAYTSDGGNTWGHSTTGGGVDDMAFVNDSLGYIVGNLQEDGMYRSTNGGITWNYIPVSDVGEYSIQFVNGSIGFNAGRYMVIRKTTDQGTGWVPLVMKDNFVNVWALSDQVVLGISGTVQKSTDGGETWHPTFLYDPLNAGLYSVFFTDSNTGFVGTNSGGRIYKTTDAGESWSLKNTPGAVGRINDIYFINHNVGWATTNSGLIMQTSDSGENWIIKASIGGNAVQFFNNLEGYTVTGYFNKTSDGGSTWSQSLLPNGSWDMFFKNANEGWVISTNKLHYTSNAGNTWILINGVSDFGYGKFCWIEGARGFIIGYKVFYTSDGGYTWIDISSTTVNTPYNRMHCGNGYSGYAVGDLGLVVKYFDSAYTPVELTNFIAKVEGHSVFLEWETIIELNNKGFIVERSEKTNEFNQIVYIPGIGNSSRPNNYFYEDKNLEQGKYSYRLKQINYDGKYFFSGLITVFISASNENILLQNFPNPFNSNTEIIFKVSSPEPIKLYLYNALGERIQLITEGLFEANLIHRIILYSGNLSSGIYYCALYQGNLVQIKKIILLK